MPTARSSTATTGSTVGNRWDGSTVVLQELTSKQTLHDNYQLLPAIKHETCPALVARHVVEVALSNDRVPGTEKQRTCESRRSAMKETLHEVRCDDFLFAGFETMTSTVKKAQTSAWINSEKTFKLICRLCASCSVKFVTLLSAIASGTSYRKHEIKNMLWRMMSNSTTNDIRTYDNCSIESDGQSLDNTAVIALVFRISYSEPGMMRKSANVNLPSSKLQLYLLELPLHRHPRNFFLKRRTLEL